MNELPDLGVLDRRLRGLQRPADTGVTTGLCRAVSARYGIDPLVVRLAVIALTFAGGLGVVAYLWGTLLTPRVGGRTPILALVPSFGEWSRAGQWILVGVTSLLLLAPLTAFGGPPLIPIVLLVLVVWLIRRGRRGREPLQGSEAFMPGAPDTAAHHDEAAPTAPQTVEEWRRHVARHAAARPGGPEPLPVVDLYGPTAPAAPPAPPARPVSWLGAVVIAALAAAAGVLGPLVLGVPALPLGAPVAVCATLGVCMFLWALLVRSRRLPVTLLVLALIAGAGTAALAHRVAGPPHLPAWEAERLVGPVDGTQVTEHDFFATDGVLDLTDTPLDVPTEIRVNAVASSVRVLLPGAPLEIVRDEVASELRVIADEANDVRETQITLVIEGVASEIEVEYPA